jgi:hypothetical protein
LVGKRKGCPPVRLISTASSWSTAARSPPEAIGDNARTGRLEAVEMLSAPGATNPADAMATRAATVIATEEE